jgi:hypothetical protein
MSEFQKIAVIVSIFIMIDCFRYFRYLKLKEKVDQLEFKNNVNLLHIKSLQRQLRRCKNE